MNNSKGLILITLLFSSLMYQNAQSIDSKKLLIGGGLISAAVGFKLCNTTFSHDVDHQDCPGGVCPLPPRGIKRSAPAFATPGNYRNVGSALFYGGIIASLFGFIKLAKQI